MSEGWLWWRPVHFPAMDGLVQLLRQPFETEDQLVQVEMRRIQTIGAAQQRRLVQHGVKIELRLECGTVYNPPEEGDERVWAIEYFKDRLVELVAHEEELLTRLLEFQRIVFAMQQTSITDPFKPPQGTSLTRPNLTPSQPVISVASSSTDGPDVRLGHEGGASVDNCVIPTALDPLSELQPADASSPAEGRRELRGQQHSAPIASPPLYAHSSQSCVPVAPVLTMAHSCVEARTDGGLDKAAMYPGITLLPDEYLRARMERVGALERAGLWRLASEETAEALVLCKQHHDNQIRLGAGKLIARLMAEGIRRYAARGRAARGRATPESCAKQRALAVETQQESKHHVRFVPTPRPPRIQISLGLPRFTGDECLINLEVGPSHSLPQSARSSIESSPSSTTAHVEVPVNCERMDEVSEGDCSASEDASSGVTSISLKRQTSNLEGGSSSTVGSSGSPNRMVYRVAGDATSGLDMNGDCVISEPAWGINHTQSPSAQSDATTAVSNSGGIDNCSAASPLRASKVRETNLRRDVHGSGEMQSD